jgi:hypothetical protein
MTRQGASSDELTQTRSKRESTETLLKSVGALVAVGSLFWGVTTFLITSRHQSETRLLEARKPFLDRQLTLYTEATQTAAILATSENPVELEKARRTFWELYWGNLAMVENGGLVRSEENVEAAMVKFGACLSRHCKQDPDLQQLALRLAHACRDSLAVSWDVRDWQTPSYSK